MTTQERQEYAAQLKREMNCCQAVVRAFADTLDMSEDKLMQLAAGFGAGMGLPNMKKNTDTMEIESTLGVGTTITMTVNT